MERYEEFARRCLSRLMEANGKPPAESPSRPGSSVICFYGLAVLPPLLTDQRREEMLKHKYEAIKLLKQRSEAQLDPKVLQIQTLLNSVQLRKAPTLLEFINSEPDVGMPGSTNCHWELSSQLCSTAKPAQGRKESDLSFNCLSRNSPEFPSKACHVSDTSSALTYHSDTCPNTEISSHVSHHSLSSGYITNDNMEVTGHTESTGEHVPFGKDRCWMTQENPTIRNTDGLHGCADAQSEKNSMSQLSLEPGQSERCGPGVYEGPYCMSLHNLLKQSQQYRKKQRQLRLAKARAQETGETQNLSDKENNESPLVEKIGFTKAKERRSNTAKVRFSLSDMSYLDMTPQSHVRRLSCITEVQSSFRSDKECCEKNFDYRAVNTKISKDTQPTKQGSLVFCLPSVTPGSDYLAGSSVTQSKIMDKPVDSHKMCALTVDTCKKTFGIFQGQNKVGGMPQQVLGAEKFRTFPSPQLCASPVRCNKNRNSARKLLVNTALNVDDNTGPLHKPSNNIDQSVQISQLEMNLSSLKALISDLECTLTECPSQEMSDGEPSFGGEQVVPPPLGGEQVEPQESLGSGEEQRLTHHMTSLTQKQRVPNAFHDIPGIPYRGPVLVDTTNQQTVQECGLSANRSYDVETPSSLWLQGEAGATMIPGMHSLQGSPGAALERMGEGLESQAKRRLLMSDVNVDPPRTPALLDRVEGGRPDSSTPKAKARTLNDLQPQQNRAVYIQALVKKQQRQEQQLLQPHCLSSPSWRPLVAAAVRGYLTRRLLCTERVALLSRTVKDSESFLLALRPQIPGNVEYGSRQDLLLQERVLHQLRAARFEIHDIFFCLSTADRMQIIAWDRALSRERQLKHKENGQKQGKERSSLSAATKKSLERKRNLMIQRKVVRRLQKAGGSQFHEHPCRVRTSVMTSRPR